MKRELLSFARAMGLLRPGDRVMRVKSQLMHYGRNRRFVRTHPDFPFPPADLAFDAYNKVDCVAYLESGISHAELYARIIREHAPAGPLAILEWGCGPGRIIRHMQRCANGHAVTLTGSDVNRRSIAWNREHLPGVNFVVNDFMPPLSFADNTFDVIYNFSVFTHLSEETQKAWARELLRVLKPGGLFICSTHGIYYRNRLAGKAEARQFNEGRVVVQSHYAEGKKWFLALHPERYVREQLLRDFGDVQIVSVEGDSGMTHDIWIAHKSVAPIAAAATHVDAI